MIQKNEFFNQTKSKFKNIMSTFQEFLNSQQLSDSEKIMYEDAYNAISINEAWDFLKNFEITYPNESFLFSNIPEIISITNSICSSMKVSHSGASFGCVMRNMENYAKHFH